ncbi:MAG: tRNA (N(6)-L-threonylcarbamoyladenosine(37)-C(2))-methylthiotransferase MtaB [Paludibacteraceae bacterium]|nr:tRNA (N(6)-L-threonylcarbamoyladenosine(37)-C(2))-methylthiotransferase MtaB [Paludibacteraceae bacterium]
MQNNKKILFQTLGCKLNFAESSAIGRQLTEIGYTIVSNNETPDIVVINTCSVTDTADKKGRQLIHRIVRSFPNAYVIVTGCYAQLKANEISTFDGVDLVLGANEKVNITEYIDAIDRKNNPKVNVTPLAGIINFKPECSADDRTRHFLKVQDGCNYFCTYCTIPYARGRSRSASVAETIEIAKCAIADGAHEIVLTGVNTGDFGRNTNETFLDLLLALDNINADVRYRISSIEPNLLTDEIIQFVAHSSHFAPHFHIPLQSGSDTILKLMRRRYDTSLFAEKLATIKSLMPRAFIGVDVITGTRGETEAYFEEGRQFIESQPISQLHVFTYSERANTKALEIRPIIPMHERRLRTSILQQISNKKLESFYQSEQGKPAIVLWEDSKEKVSMFGFTENYVRQSRPYDPAMVNVFEKIIIDF